MDFEDLKKVWNQQKQETMYVVDQSSLHRMIAKKKNKVIRTAVISEYFIASVNFGGAIFVIANGVAHQTMNVYTYILSVIMALLSIYVLAHRYRRRKLASQFDRSMLGDLDFAIENANYQAILSKAVLFSALPIGGVSLMAVWHNKGFGPAVLGLVLVFAIALWLGGWEHEQIYKARKKQLQKMRNKLVGIEA